MFQNNGKSGGRSRDTKWKCGCCRGFILGKGGKERSHQIVKDDGVRVKRPDLIP